MLSYFKCFMFLTVARRFKFVFNFGQHVPLSLSITNLAIDKLKLITVSFLMFLYFPPEFLYMLKGKQLNVRRKQSQFTTNILQWVKVCHKVVAKVLWEEWMITLLYGNLPFQFFLDLPNIHVITGLLWCFSPAVTLKMNQVRTSSTPLESQQTAPRRVMKPYTWMFLGIVQVHRWRMSPSYKNDCFIHKINGPMLCKIQITIF